MPEGSQTGSWRGQRWSRNPISTSPLEGTNNKIELLQRRAYGDRRNDHFKLRLLTLHHTKFTLAG